MLFCFHFYFIFNDPFWIIDKPLYKAFVFEHVFNSRQLQNYAITQLIGNVFSGLGNVDSPKVMLS